MSPTREFWNVRYAQEDYLYGTRPNAFLVEQSDRLGAAARVLVIGDGEGRNGVWLAEQGHAVTTLDYAQAAVDKAARLAAQRGVEMRAIHADFLQWDWPEGEFDAAVAIFVHLQASERRRIHAALLAALRPGGMLILEAFTPEQLRYASGGPRDAALLYTAAQLRGDLAGAELLLLEERLTVLDEGPGHRGEGAVVRLVARRR